MLINVFCPSNAGKVWIRSFAKPAAIAAHAIIVTNHPRTPTLNPIKSPNALFSNIESSAILIEVTRNFGEANGQHQNQDRI